MSHILRTTNTVNARCSMAGEEQGESHEHIKSNPQADCLSAVEGISFDRAVSLGSLRSVNHVQVGDSSQVPHRLCVSWFCDHQCVGARESHAHSQRSAPGRAIRRSAAHLPDSPEVRPIFACTGLLQNLGGDRHRPLSPSILPAEYCRSRRWHLECDSYFDPALVRHANPFRRIRRTAKSPRSRKIGADLFPPASATSSLALFQEASLRCGTVL